jgi:hypothetical protein
MLGKFLPIESGRTEWNGDSIGVVSLILLLGGNLSFCTLVAVAKALSEEAFCQRYGIAEKGRFGLARMEGSESRLFCPGVDHLMKERYTANADDRASRAERSRYYWKVSTAFESGPSFRQVREVLKKSGMRKKVVFPRCRLADWGWKWWFNRPSEAWSLEAKRLFSALLWLLWKPRAGSREKK